MHIVLVPAPDIRGTRTVPYFPLGILSLHRVLSDAGHNCRIYAPVEKATDEAEPAITIRRWAAEIAETNPDLVGFSTMCGTYPLSLLLARGTQHACPDASVVLGGPQASVVAEESLAAFPWIDFVVRGEAETAVLDLVQVLSGEKRPEQAGNLTYRMNGEILSTPSGPLLEDLDSLPLPDYRAYPLHDEAMSREDYLVRERHLALEAGRGCHHGCSFCATADFWQRRRRQKSPRLLAGQMDALARTHDVGAVALEQDLFAEEGDWLNEFLIAMRTSSGVRWGCSLRPDSVRPGTMAVMYRAGCRYVFFGVESGSQRTQKRIGKSLDLAETREVVEAAVECGIRVAMTFVVGFPWETREDLQATLSLFEHFQSVGVATNRVMMLCPMPKTHITTSYASRLGIDSTASHMSRGMEAFRDDEMDAMIREHPRIFSSFYHIEPETASREEFVFAVWAGEAMRAMRENATAL